MTTSNSPNENDDQNLWGLFRSANERKNWTGIWDDVEHSSVPIENIEHYLWDAQPDYPSSERSLLFSDLYSFLKRREVEQYPRITQIREIWYERVITAQNHYKQLSKQTNSLMPSVWFERRLLDHGVFKHYFDIRTMNLSFVFEQASDYGALTDVWYGNGITPEGIEFYLEQVDENWLTQHRPALSDEERNEWLRAKLHIDVDAKPYSDSVDSILCSLKLNHHDFQWYETELEEAHLAVSVQTPSCHEARRQRT